MDEFHHSYLCHTIPEHSQSNKLPNYCEVRLPIKPDKIEEVQLILNNRLCSYIQKGHQKGFLCETRYFPLAANFALNEEKLKTLRLSGKASEKIPYPAAAYEVESYSISYPLLSAAEIDLEKNKTIPEKGTFRFYRSADLAPLGAFTFFLPEKRVDVKKF